MTDTPTKSRMRVVSLRISDNTFELIHSLASRANISPSSLLTAIVENYAIKHNPEHMGTRSGKETEPRTPEPV